MHVIDNAACPVTTIQRLGRLNREAKIGDMTQPFAMIETENHLPYTSADLEATRSWFASLAEDCLSQKHLAEAWEQTGDQPPEFVASAWLDGGPKTEVTELREGSPGITVLMEQDLSRVKANRTDLGRLSLPMTQTSLPWQSWRRERGLPVAPKGTITYCKLRGAEWKNA